MQLPSYSACRSTELLRLASLLPPAVIYKSPRPSLLPKDGLRRVSGCAGQPPDFVPVAAHGVVDPHVARRRLAARARLEEQQQVVALVDAPERAADALRGAVGVTASRQPSNAK